MTNSIFNQNIYLEYPNGFTEMNEAEIKKYFAGDLLRFGVKQFCEMTVVKGKRCFYTVYCVCRLNDVSENKAVFTALRSSMKTL